MSRPQSTISATNPNAVSVETRRRHPSRVTTGVSIESGQRVDCAIHPLAAIEGVQHRVKGRRRPAAGTECRTGACAATVHAFPMLCHRNTQSLGVEAVSTRGAVRSSRHRGNPRCAPSRGRLLPPRWESPPPRSHPDAAAVQMPGTTRVGLDPISRGPLQLRRRGYQTIDPRVDQLASQPKPAQASLIRPQPPARAMTGSSRGSRLGPASAAAEEPHLFPGPIRTRPPSVRAHPTRHSYADTSLGPPTCCVQPARTTLTGKPTVTREEAPAQPSYRLQLLQRLKIDVKCGVVTCGDTGCLTPCHVDSGRFVSFPLERTRAATFSVPMRNPSRVSA